MLRFGNYVRAANIDDALEVLRFKRGAKILGGGVWMRLSDRTVPVVIDLSDCGLDTIEETEDEYRIGAYVTLRDLETAGDLNRACGGVLSDAIRDIVGVQMRRLATVGGSVFGRFGFSDVICALLALDCEVELAQAGRVPLAEFVDMPYDLDILTHVIVRKHDCRAAYRCVRKAATDFPTSNACAAYWGGEWHVAVGARPARARLLSGAELGIASAEPTAEELERAIGAVRGLAYSSNMWGSERYRRHVAGVLAARAVVDAAPFSTGGARDAARAALAAQEVIA